MLSSVLLADLNSLGLPAKAVGAGLSLILSECFGRRASFIAMQFIVLAGISLCFAAKTFNEVLGGRILIMTFIGWQDYLTPMYLAEIVPAPVRGFVVGTYVSSHVTGSFLVAVITYVTGNRTDNLSWKIPIAVMFAFPALTLLLCWLVPESPRWLVRRGKIQRAQRTLKQLSGSRPDYSPEREIELLQESLEESTTKGSWRDLFRGPVNTVSHSSFNSSLHRHIWCMLTKAAATNCDRHCDWHLRSTYRSELDYAVRYYLCQVTENHEPSRVWFSGPRSLSVIMPVILFAINDRVGRRPLYIWGAFIYGSLLYIVGGLGIGEVDALKGKLIVAFFMMSGYAYLFSLGGSYVSPSCPLASVCYGLSNEHLTLEVL